jgi:hypothetical protein
MTLHPAGHIQRNGESLLLKIPGTGTFVVGRAEATAAIDHNRTASVVARSSEGKGGSSLCWFEAGRMTRSRSGNALILHIRDATYTASVRGVAELLSGLRRYAVLAKVR